MNYAALVRALFPRLSGGIRWGTERVERLLAAAGDPHRQYRAVHVGGTNGKGSTASFLATVLAESGLRVGLYTSPHLCTFRERIRIDGTPVTEAALVESARTLWPLIQGEDLSFFESTTAIAFQVFADAAVDVAVIEVGLGGRLDATNVIEPEVVALTNVSLDHADYLGETLDAVAREKAGIIKSEVPVVTAETDPDVLALIRECAERRESPLFCIEPSSVTVQDIGTGGTAFHLRTRTWGELELRTRLIGAHQATNAALALLALEQLPAELRPDRDSVRRGVERTRLEGRMQLERIDGACWLFDVAHNPAGVAALVRSLEDLSLPRPHVAVVGILGDKDWDAMLPRLREGVDRIVLTTPPTAPRGRSWDPVMVRQKFGGSGIHVVADLDAALARGRELAQDGTVLVTGSFHTVGDALLALGLSDASDAAPVTSPAPGEPLPPFVSGV